ncbi:hypothetical protein [Lapillicoccus jejuensis]|uniref:hypothetical protein n=1 Tax=Lapillicoccus jejuensis TaxID=402171 RepID=UPI001477467C|nr:hypothetical protein [Lapillicoccus jejuensis]
MADGWAAVDVAVAEAVAEAVGLGDVVDGVVDGLEDEVAEGDGEAAVDDPPQAARVSATASPAAETSRDVPVPCPRNANRCCATRSP